MAKSSDIKISVGGEDLKVGIVSWNMGNAKSAGWDTEMFPNGAAGYDIVVIGLQESTYGMSKEEVTASEEAAAKLTQVRRANLMNDLVPCFDDLRNQIHEALGTDFLEINNSYRAQMQIFAFARKNIFKEVSNVEVRIENTGIMGIFPNKGGLLLCFDIYGTTLAFVTCHLAAHEGVNFCTVRNDSIKEILGGVRVGDTRFDVSNQKHHMFWMGDMNYRVTTDPATPAASKRDEEISKERQAELEKMNAAEENGDERDDEEEGAASADKKERKRIERAQIIELVKANDWNAILKFDELNREMAANRALAGFTALQPSFPPTFKRVRHKTVKGDYKTSKFQVGKTAEEVCTYYDAKRCPAFTDRVLYRSMPHFASNLQPQEFRSFEGAGTSDHKPVRATFTLRPTLGPSDILVDPKVEDLLPGKSGIKAMIKEGRGVQLVLKKMKGKDLAEMDAELFGGLSDPYIVATADPDALMASPFVQSSIIKHTLNPEWPAEEKMKIPLLSNDVDGMSRNGHLFLSVWDYDMTNEDDLIGLCRIPLQAIFSAAEQGKPYTFDEEVYENGEVTGRLMGEISMGGKGLTETKAVMDKNRADMKKLNEVSIEEDCCVPGCTIA